MYFNNIINKISDIIIFYYIIYRNKHNDIINNKQYQEIHRYLQYLIRNMYSQRFDPSGEIHSVDVLFEQYRKTYMYIDDDIMMDIFNDIETYLNEYTIINNNDSVISINTCPFDGLIIDHGMIIHNLDLYFY